MGEDSNVTKLFKLLQENSTNQISKALDDIHPADIIDALDEYEGDRTLLLSRFPIEVLAAIIEEAEDDEKGELFDLFSIEKKKEIVNEMASDELVDLLETMDPEEASDMLDSMDEEDAQDIKELMRYHPETAGGIMATEFVAIVDEMTIEETLKYLQTHGDEAESLSYLYVLNHDEILQGVVSLRDVVTTPFDAQIAPLINTNVISVKPELDQEEVSHIFTKYGFASVPVVDENNKMLGIITADDILDVVLEESTDDIEKMAALSHGEGTYLETGVFKLSKQRMFWLLFLMISATFTGVIIQGYEQELASFVILAAFIPMLMDTGGNAGSQSSTLVIRGMALGEISNKDYLIVLYKELLVSGIVGLVLAFVNFLRVWLFYKDIMLALTVSCALIFTVILAKTVGSMLPILAKKLKIDPAIMAAPIITTIVDAISLIIYLHLAKLLYIGKTLPIS
ncbi:MAG: magnesium transporter [Candidatus Cloacimonadales bacterium]|jgi:magnesium transporter|nr:magnesium transporter [Candidatus Cloacimonadota bacterium]MDD2651313.1 magnesium transporter [Candidatus Cloacimonadota bacterium]MDX9978153.1 magnesium transporter [Candidatus Cloacimonadales bacterium]